MAQTTTSAEVALPARASGAVVLRDRASQMSISFALEGAGDVPPEIVDGLAVYPNAFGDRAHLVHAVGANGTEDLVLLDEARPLTYRVELVNGVSGVRLVEDVLEFVDAEGAPRLRMTAPWMRAAGGDSIALGVETDCAHDRDASAPWHRRIVAPGGSSCAVTVRPTRAVAGPVVIDPMWKTTMTMIEPRASYALLQLASGPILAAGGTPTWDHVTATAELYDPASGTWAATGSMKRARAAFNAVVMNDGTPMAIGGEDDTDGLTSSTTETYDPTSGVWSNATSLRYFHELGTANVLPSGHVAVIGGGDENGDSTASIEIFDPQAKSWDSRQVLNGGRARHTATLLPTGDLMLVGGLGEDGGPLKSVEAYSEQHGVVVAASMASPRYSHVAGVGPDGRLLVAGGATTTDVPLALAEIYDHDTGLWTTAPPLEDHFQESTATSMKNGCLVVASGSSGGDNGKGLTMADAFDFRTNRWTTLPALAQGRLRADALALDEARLLIAGGQPTLTTVIDDASILTMSANGAACAEACACTSGICEGGRCCQGSGDLGSKCSSACECTSGICTDGVCCNKACDGTCEACSAKAKGSGADGTCGAVAAGSDPRMDCRAEPASTCGMTGTCDGRRACATFKDETACGAPVCREHELFTSACKTGECTEATIDCSPFTCGGDPAACLTTCKNVDDCAKGFVCTSAHQCIPTPNDNPAGESGGCCGVAGRSADDGWYAALLPAVLALAAARRRRRRTA